MAAFASTWNSQSAVAQHRREAMLARISQLRELEERAAAASARSKPVFDKRGQLLPRERVALLLDPGAPYLPLCSLAGYLHDTREAQQSVPGGGIVAGIGFVSGVRAWWSPAIPGSRPARSSRWAWTRSCACRKSRWRTSCPLSTSSKAPART